MSHSRLISMLIGLGMLSACSDADDRKQSAQNDNGADVSLNVSGQNGAAKIEGRFKLPSIRLGTSDVDIAGVPLYPGAVVRDVDVAGEEGQSEGSVTIRFDSDASLVSVRDYYLIAFRKRRVAASLKGNDITGRDLDGKPFSIAMTAEGESMRGVIRLGSKGG